MMLHFRKAEGRPRRRDYRPSTAVTQASLNAMQRRYVTLPTLQTLEKLDREIFGDEYVDLRKELDLEWGELNNETI